MSRKEEVNFNPETTTSTAVNFPILTKQMPRKSSVGSIINHKKNLSLNIRFKDGLSVTGRYLELTSCLSQLFHQDLVHFFCLRHFLAGLGGPSSTHHSQELQRQTVYLLMCRNNFEDKRKTAEEGKYVQRKAREKGIKEEGILAGLVTKVKIILLLCTSQQPKITNTGPL